MSELSIELKNAITAIGNAATKSTVEKLQQQVDQLDIKMDTKNGNESQQQKFV
jgi:hypothetical protein